MARRPNAAARPDLQPFLQQGVDSQTNRVDKPPSDASDIHDNKTSGAGVFIRKAQRPVATRKRTRETD